MSEEVLIAGVKHSGLQCKLPSLDLSMGGRERAPDLARLDGDRVFERVYPCREVRMERLQPRDLASPSSTPSS